MIGAPELGWIVAALIYVLAGIVSGLLFWKDERDRIGVAILFVLWLPVFFIVLPVLIARTYLANLLRRART